MDRRGLGRNLLSNISGSPGNGGREKSRKVERGRKKMRRNNKKEVENEGTGIGKDQASERASERRKEREEARDGEAVGGGGGIGSAFPGAKVARRPNAIPISARTSREPTTAPVSPPLTPPRRPQERENSPHRIGSMDERKRKKERKKEKKEERKERKGKEGRRGEEKRWRKRGWAVKANRAIPPVRAGWLLEWADMYAVGAPLPLHRRHLEIDVDQAEGRNFCAARGRPGCTRSTPSSACVRASTHVFHHLLSYPVPPPVSPT